MSFKNMAIVAWSLAASVLVPAALNAEQEIPFKGLLEPYEAIRQALLHDGLEGVRGSAASIRGQVEAILAETDQPDRGDSADQCGDCLSALAEISAAAAELEDEQSITAARDAFGRLSQPMIRLREMADGERPVVVYCAMAKKSWLQPRGEIGNPYYGQSMARCGEVVAE